MTTLAITPNYDKKRLKFSGTVAAGEHVAVTVSGGADWIKPNQSSEAQTLRLRVIYGDKTVAVFPRPDETGDEWETAGSGNADAVCELNLNSIPAEKYLKCGGNCLWVLDDRENHTLYGMGEFEVGPWPKHRGVDEPIDLDGYPQLVEDVEELKAAWEAYKTTVNAALEGKADRATTYTKSETDAAIVAAKNGRFKVVQELPSVAEAESNVIYLVPRTDGETGNVYDEWVVVDGAWDKIGTADVDLTDYYNKTEADTLLVGKVDKETGKGLSTNDYTTAEKQKLNGIEAGAQVNTIETVKVNGTALTPENKAVDVTVPVKATTKPVIAGVAAIGNSSKFAAENHVHPAETEVKNGDGQSYNRTLPIDCFPITYTYGGTNYTISADNGNAGIYISGGLTDEFSLADTANSAQDYGRPIALFGWQEEAANYNKFVSVDTGVTNLKFNGKDPTADNWPALSTDSAIIVRELQVAKDADVLKNSGNQTLDGTLSVKHTRIEEGKIVYDVGATGESNLMFPPALNDYIAVLSDMYAAVQQIAPAFEERTDQNPYMHEELVSKDGVVYQCDDASFYGPWAAESWVAKKVSELFLPLTGGTITGSLTVGTRRSGEVVGVNSVAEGDSNTASGERSHSEGAVSIASGRCSHAENIASVASGNYSHAEGTFTTAQNIGEHSQGAFNDSHKASTTFGSAGNTLSSIGFGSNEDDRKNAVETMQDGKTFIYGLGGYDGTNPTGSGIKDLATAVGEKAPLASPAFTGTPTAPTPTAGDNSTKVATTAFVQGAVGAIKTFQHDAGGYYIEVEA